MRRFRALIKKELTHMVRDPRTLIFVFMMPILQLVLLGYVNNTDFTNVPTAVVNRTTALPAGSCWMSFNRPGTSPSTIPPTARPEVNTLIAGGTGEGGDRDPADYSQNLNAGHSGRCAGAYGRLGSDHRQRGAFGGTAGGAGPRGKRPRPATGAARGLGASGHTPIDVRTNVLYNPDLLSSYNIVPGLIAIILFQTATSLTALSIVRERERGTIEQLIVTPIRNWELVVAKMIPYILVSFADTFLILLVGTLLFGVPIRGSLLLLLALTGLYLLPTLGYGLVISTLAQTQQQAQLMIMPLMLPAFMLSGYIFPISSLPIVLQFVGYLLPTTYFIYVMRAVVVKGVGLSLILPQTAILAVFGIALVALAAWRFRKRLD